ncbi:IS66 family transposase [Vibrio sp. SA48]
MKKTPDINPESQDIAELQAMVKALMSEKNEWQQERQSLIEQFKLALDRQFAKRSEALKPYNEAQGDLFNEAECEAAKAEDEVITTTTTTIKRRGKRQPLYQALKTHLLEQVVVQADETPLNVLKEDKQCYMWLYCSGADSPEAKLPDMKNIALFDYQNSRARACPVNFLGDYSGYLQSDGYAAYDGLTNVANVGCFAHARRKFMEAKKLQGKGKSGKADVALAKIQKLYALESRLKLASVEERWTERQAQAKPMLDDFYDWLTTQKVIESSPLGKAIKYTLGQWPKLIRYVEDGHLSIDNNRAERAIKSLVIGRKNWLFSTNPLGADASALLYSIIETAKANGLILYDYMVKCMRELAKPEPDINSLLPWNFSH